MRLGVALSTIDTWHFFNELYKDFQAHYETEIYRFSKRRYLIFNERSNKSRFHRSFGEFLGSNEVVFFEWASYLLHAATTQHPKKSKILTRLHRYELFEWADKIDWDPVDRIIFVSQAMLRKFADQFPTHCHKGVVIPVGVSLERFQPSPKSFSGDLGILCNLAPRKRVYELILAFYELRKVAKDLHLHVAGGYEPFHRDYYDALEGAVRKLGLQDWVTFYGNVPDPENWYPKIDIFISNSYSEGLQVAPMEAMACGCYCLSHHWDGAEELVPAENIYWTDMELIQKVLAYCDLSQERKESSRAQMREIIADSFDITSSHIKIRQEIDNLGGA